VIESGFSIPTRIHDWTTETEASFAIVDPDTDRLLGSIARHGPPGHHVSFGYWLAPEARSHGIATRALRLIVEWTLATTAAIRLELFTDVDNDASGHVAERAGFRREGVRWAWDLDRHGQPIDAVFYVRIRGETT
jgi:RimJ/RimL family protein N-acetyltransferase